MWEKESSPSASSTTWATSYVYVRVRERDYMLMSSNNFCVSSDSSLKYIGWFCLLLHRIAGCANSYKNVHSHRKKRGPRL